MRDEPTGRYALKLKGKPLNARTFHFYKDCGHIAGFTNSDEAELITPSDEVVEMLEMRACQACFNRSEDVSAEDTIAETLDDVPGMIDWDSSEVAAKIIAALSLRGYTIRKGRRGTQASREAGS